jgi:hypothetical protein
MPITSGEHRRNIANSSPRCTLPLNSQRRSLLNEKAIEQQDQSIPLLASAALVLATLIASYALTQSPRGFGVWLTTLFICWVEALTGALIFWRRAAEHAPSGATSAILFSTTFTYAAAGIASVLPFLFMRGNTGDFDRTILGVLWIETVIFLFIMRALAHHDRSAKLEECQTTTIHDLRSSQGSRIADAIAVVTSRSNTDDEGQRRTDKIAKRLFAMKTALMHSHAPAITSDADADISTQTDALNAAAARFRSTIPNSEPVSEIELITENLETLLRKNRIL